MSDELFICVPTPPDPVAVLREEVERLRAEIDAMRLEKNNMISTWRGRAGRAEIEKDKLSIDRAKLLAEVERLRAALLTATGMLSEVHISSAEKCQMTYDYLRETCAERGGGR